MSSIGTYYPAILLVCLEPIHKQKVSKLRWKFKILITLYQSCTVKSNQSVLVVISLENIKSRGFTKKIEQSSKYTVHALRKKKWLAAFPKKGWGAHCLLGQTHLDWPFSDSYGFLFQEGINQHLSTFGRHSRNFQDKGSKKQVPNFYFSRICK